MNRLNLYTYCLQRAWLLLIGMLLLVSCKPTVPSEYIQPGEMEDLLYDYHVAMSMAEQQNVSFTQQKAYKLKVFEKYDVTEAEFDDALKYYIRHTEQLKKIYENISKRLENEARTQGLSATDFSQYGEASLNGDTTNVWNKTKSLVLQPQITRNYENFEIKVDTAFHRGDQLSLEFDPQFIVQDGTREGVAVFTVTFKNDSIATQTVRFFDAGHQILTIYDDKKLGIKRVRGYFYMPQPTETSTTFRLLLLTNIKLIRMHEQKEKHEQIENSAFESDSTETTDPVRMVGGERVNKEQNGPPVTLQSHRTVDQAMRERNIPRPTSQ